MSASRRYVALLRGVNVGRAKALAMSDLVRVTAGLGHTDVRTHLRSGNVVFTAAPGVRAGKAGATRIARDLEAALADELGLDTGVVVRSQDQLAAVIAADPLGDVADDPARHLVAFLSEPLPAKVVKAVDADAYLPERFAVEGAEVHLWCPDGVNKAKLPKALSAPGVIATARNWNTVTKLLALLQA